MKASPPAPPPQEDFSDFETEDSTGGMDPEPTVHPDAIREPRPPEQEDIGEFVTSLRKSGFEVSLVTAAQWGTEQRQTVRKWLLTMDASRVPGCLAPFFSAVVADLLDPNAVLKQAPNVGKELETKWAEDAARDALARGILPTGPVTPAITARPAFAPKPVVLEDGLPDVSRMTIPQLMVATGHAVDRMEPERISDSPDFNRLVETVLRELDLDAEYTELEQLLEIGDNRRDFATLMEEVDKADRRALRANALWANAVIVYEGLKLDQQEVDAVLWKDAKAILEKAEPEEEEEASETPPETKPGAPKKKRAKARKPITNTDVDAKIAELYPDEWRSGRMRLKKAEIAVDRTEAFAKRWAERTRSLQVMLSVCRKS